MDENLPIGLKKVVMCALFAAMGWPAAAGDALTARVRPRIGAALSDVVIQAIIEPNALNRWVTFAADSKDFYTSSLTELDGDRAPRIMEMRFRTLPEGSYEVRVTLYGTDGQRG